MKPSVTSTQHYNSKAQNYGFTPCSWSAIRMSSYDRTPEGSRGPEETSV